MSGTELNAIPKIRKVYYLVYASFPTTGLSAGDLAFATDRLVLYRWSGAAWVAITYHLSSGLLAAIPAAATLPNGSLYYGTDTTLLYQVQAGAWVTITAVAYTDALALAAMATKYKIVTKTADETVNNSTTLQNDDELLLAVSANNIWEVKLHLRVTCNTTSKFKMAWTVPAGGSILCIGYTSMYYPTRWNTNEVAMVEVDGTTAVTVSFAGTGAALLVRARYIGGGTAGTLQFQWAQGTAQVFDTKVLAGSALIGMKLK